MNNSVENSENNQAPIEMQKPKKSKGPIVIIIFLVIALLGTIGYILYDKGIVFSNNQNTSSGSSTENINQNTNNNANNNSGSEQKNETNTIETEITDKNIIDKISTKVNTIVTNKYFIGANINGKDIFAYNEHLFIDTKLTDTDKLLLVLSNITPGKITISVDKMGNSDYKNNYQVGDVESGGQISFDEVDKNYKNLFGTSILNYSIDSNYYSCPMYFYDSVNKVYYTNSSCGGLYGGDIPTYINKITEKNNEAYAYVSVGVVDYSETGTGNDDNTYIYYGYDSKKVIEKISPSKWDSMNYKYEINSSNYDKFSEYKVTLTKDGDNYYYKSIEKTK